MKTLRIICRVAIGLLFIFSGYVKAIDPMGSHIIFGEYFKAFHLTAIMPVFLPLVVVGAPIAELLIGFCALMGVRMKETAWAAVLFMVFFTILTFILAVFNPVTDCGCFGNAIKLTNWETFFKNLVILPFVGVLFWQRKNYKSFASCRAEWITAACLLLFSGGLMWYSYRHLPLIDFMAYKVGNNIKELMTYPENAETDVYETKLYYEKDGKTQEFGMSNLPDSTWKFVDSKSILVKKGYEPPIHDFTIITADGRNIADSVLSLPGYVFLLAIPHTETASTKQMAKVNALADYCMTQDNLHFFALTGSGDEQKAEFAATTGAMYPFYSTDEKPLMSMVRSSPGLLVMNNATVLAKWSRFDIPTPEEVEKEIVQQQNEKIIIDHQIYERMITEILAVITFAAMIVWGVIFRRLYKKRLQKQIAASKL